MISEQEEWKPRNRYNDNGNADEGQQTRRPYQSYNNRVSYGNQNGNYNRPQSNYDRPNGNYDRQAGGYERRPNYNRPNSGDYANRRPNFERREGGYERRENNYERRDGGYNSGNYTPKPRQYDNYQSYDNPSRNYDSRNQTLSDEQGGAVKKRRPRVGDMQQQPMRGNYQSNRPQNPYQQNNRRPNNYQQQPYGARPNNKFQKQGGPKQQQQNPNQKFNINKQYKYREENFDPNEELRLNKFLANAGVCSRREADEFIQAGLVKVNGNVITELGVKVKRSDEVIFHNDPVKLEQKIYVLLNKPKNCVTTAEDPQERLTVMDLVKSACHERIFPVGRLDRNTTGVLLLTNDGDLASKLTHPKYLKKKIYHVWLDKDVTVEDMQKMADGIELEDGEIHADAISYVSDSGQDQVGIEIHSGRNRVVRRMFETLGYHVIKLDRVYFAGLTKKNLKRGQWRYLNDKEVSMLRMGAFD
ncbi:MAG: pseudouridine synthase [Dysgonamonadaceae bacterium]|jgi:23S rRNA pseudouridine2605 synthase|nr:pseudouridine synthase [Dysgonamonadaceae bacterium]